ncbi:MAG: hypothetical protein ACRD3E_07060 [Terriglobales bacterium]
MKRVTAAVVLVLFTATTAVAGTGIGTVTKLLERRYGVHHHGVPALWLAKPFMFGSGVGGLKIAQFESFTVASGDMAALMDEVGRALGPEWRPFVQVWSKDDREWSVIYAAADGEKLRMLIVSSEQGDGVTLVQMDVSGKVRDEWFDEPVKSARRNSRANRSGH